MMLAGLARRGPGRAATAAVLVAVATTAAGQGTVQTLGGGPFDGSPSYPGYVDGSTADVAKFNTPSGLALDSTGNFLFVADRDNNAVRRLSLAAGITETFAGAAKGINKPVAVAVDAYDRVYVVNQGNGNNGTVLKFDRYRNFLGTLATNLPKAAAVALDGSGNAYVAINDNTVLRLGTAVSNVVGKITAAGTALRGIAVLDSGVLALSDSGNHGIWLLDPDTGVATRLTGFKGAGDEFGSPDFARFNQPQGLAKAGGGMLVVADRGNHRVKVLDASGTVSHLYGVAAADWVAGWPWPGWYDGTACDNGFGSCAEAREPVGVVVAADGTLYASEVYYHIIRKLTGSGLTGPGTGGGGSGTNIVVAPPVISPNAGYFPMGQIITVSSPNPDVFYTTDGTVPTPGSPRVVMNGNTGVIRWDRSDRDLTWLRVRAFVGTNASEVVSGQRAPTNSIGVPLGLNARLCAGVGSTLIVPIVANLRTNDRIRSLQYCVEVTPDEGNTNNISAQFRTLSILTNDFVPVVTPAQGATTAVYSATAYATSAGGGRTNRGLAISAIGTNANVVFSNYAVVGLLAVPIPATAREGHTYTIRILEASGTADGLQTPVSLPSMPPATILVTNLSYTVGDASPGGWYNAGHFGNGNLDNADVNTAFYASLGLRVPHSFSDVYDAMDAFPEDGPGFVGGDGLIRYLDWQVILQRSLRLKTNNWTRRWSTGGTRTNQGPFGLSAAGTGPEYAQSVGGWYRQALVGAVSVSGAVPNSTVSVPVYVQTVAGATLGGLQFRASITPEGASPALSQPPQFTAAPGLNPPDSLVSQDSDVACGWSLGTLAIGAHSSNLLGYLSFSLPASAVQGQSYRVSLSYADGAPDLTTAYTLECRSATVRVLAAAPPATLCSDDWRAYFFADRNEAEAADAADPDNDGAPNWQEFLAGTHPLDAASKLRLLARPVPGSGTPTRTALRWQTAPGRVYQVLQAHSPTSTDWTLRLTVTGDGFETEFVDTETTSAARFYRLRIQP